jgi:hypothetical protein
MKSQKAKKIDMVPFLFWMRFILSICVQLEGQTWQFDASACTKEDYNVQTHGTDGKKYFIS